MSAILLWSQMSPTWIAGCRVRGSALHLFHTNFDNFMHLASNLKTCWISSVPPQEILTCTAVFFVSRPCFPTACRWLPISPLRCVISSWAFDWCLLVAARSSSTSLLLRCRFATDCLRDSSLCCKKSPKGWKHIVVCQLLPFLNSSVHQPPSVPGSRFVVWGDKPPLLSPCLVWLGQQLAFLLQVGLRLPTNRFQQWIKKIGWLVEKSDLLLTRVDGFFAYARARRRQLGRPRRSFLVEGWHCGSQLLLECEKCITFCTALIFNGLEWLLDGRKMGIGLTGVFRILFFLDRLVLSCFAFQVGAKWLRNQNSCFGRCQHRKWRAASPEYYKTRGSSERNRSDSAFGRFKTT